MAASYTKNNGNFVKVRHNGTYTTQYLHMSKIKPGIRKGVYVKQGETIGYVGSTGLATGPHVCYRFWVNGKQVDPYKQDLPPGDPIKEENREVYMIAKDSLMQILLSKEE
jgi:murein DD-endopeptidase MepM/ murein hydrolase activator NlpD